MAEILDDYREIEELPLASKGQRFANYFIDQVIYNILFGVLLSTSSPATLLLQTIGEAETEVFNVLSIVGPFLIYPLFYIVQEAFFNGQTIGKRITGTRAVHESNVPMSLQVTVVRSLIRAIPIEYFSFLFSNRGWHDSWSKTKVVVIK